MSACQDFIPNPMNQNNLCRSCFRHKDEHPPKLPYHLEKQYRRYIEDILYESETEQEFNQANVYTARLLENLPPPKEYYKIFNVYSFVRQNLTNPKLKDLSPEDKMLEIYETIDFLLAIVLPLRRPQRFEQVSKLRRKKSKILKAEKLEGTQDVLKKLGYTRVTDEHFEFPPEVNQPPDQAMIREFAADLKIALEEVKCYHYKQHKFPERFLEGFEWAKKTTPFVPESELEEFDIQMEYLFKGSRTSSVGQLRDTDPFRSTVAPFNRGESGPIDNFLPSVAPPIYDQPPFKMSDLYSIAPSGPSQNDQPIPSQSVYDPPSKGQGVSMIPKPDKHINIPQNMVMCPVPSCGTLNPKNTFACKECRMSLQMPDTPIMTNPNQSLPAGIIPVEKWNCITCTVDNTTARGRPRICEVCNTTNPMPITEISPNSSVNPHQPTQPSEDLPTRAPERIMDKHPSVEDEKMSNQQQTPDYVDSKYSNPIYPDTRYPNPVGPMRHPGPDPRYHNPGPDPRYHNPGPDPRYHNPGPDPRYPNPVGPRYPNPVGPRYPNPGPDPRYPNPVDPRYPNPDPMRNPNPVGPRYPNPVPGPIHPDPRTSYIESGTIYPGPNPGYPGPFPDPSRPYRPPPNYSRPEYPDPRFGHGAGRPMEPTQSFPPDNLPYKQIKYFISQAHQKYKDETLQLALEKHGITNAHHWLTTQFDNNVLMLAESVRNAENCESTTTKEVEESYIACHGDMALVTPRIQQSRRRKMEELMRLLGISREIAVVELENNNWEVVTALDNITLLHNQRSLDACTPRIWAGSMTVPEVQSENIDEVLWDQVKALSLNSDQMDSIMTRKLLCELRIPTLTQLNLLLQLIISEETADKNPRDLLQAVKEVSDFDNAMSFLNQNCQICMEEYTANEMIQMLFCPHLVCKECYSDFLTHAIRGSAIKKWTCPVCSEPDIQQMDDPYGYFGLLSNVVQELCDQEVATLYHQKLNEFTICKRPEFRWCPHCHCGFMGREDMEKLPCPQPECGKIMCYKCKRKWEPEHDGRTCEDYQLWREENDRDILDKGLAAKLVEEGVECPCCTFKYELVRGGCMHFRCSQCPAEFCSGCFKLFKKENCQKFTSCATKGLHAHHPRNCMYFTRDMNIDKMRELLEKGGFQRDEVVQVQPPHEPEVEGAQANPPKKQKAKIYKAKVPEKHKNAVIDELKGKEGDAFKEPPKGELKIPCQIVEFKDSPDGGYEKENCSRFSLEKDSYAGLCDKHYKEYLCGLITNDGLDPIDVLEVNEDTIFELWAILKRNEIKFDDKVNGDTLKQLIKEKLPLQPMNVAGALQA